MKSDTMKFPGVLLDDDLSWKEHMKHLENKIAKNIGLMYRAKPSLHKESMLALYYSYIHDHPLYPLISTHIHSYSLYSLYPLISTLIHSYPLISNHIHYIYSYPLISTHIHSYPLYPLISTHIHSYPLISTHIHSYLNYANLAWGSTHLTNLNKTTQPTKTRYSNSP